MNRVGGTSATSRRPRPHPAAQRAAVTWALWAAAGAVQAADLSAAAEPMLGLGLTFALVVSVLAFGACVVLVLRLHREQDRLAAELREARLRSQCVDQLLDVWQWHSDAEHRVVTMRPPHGASADEWSAPQLPAFVWELFGSDDTPGLRARLDSSAPLDDLQVQRPAAGGAARRALMRARALTDATGRFAGYHGTLRDLDPVAAATATPAPAEVSAPAGANGALVKGAAATALETDHESFSFTVSHDLRAPIRVVEGFTRIIKEDYGRLLDRVGNDHLDRVLGAAARMNNMIDALLGLSKLSSQPLARQPVNLSQLAGYVADDLRRQWPERQVQIEIEPGMQVQGDPTLLREVVENLLGNAWKYTSKAAQPSIAFERHARGGHSFTVRDNGAGFDMRFADRLFGVFQRLHSANDFPGTGVGLASVRRIVRRHGGDIWGEAEVNRGARFHFSLPQGDEKH